MRQTKTIALYKNFIVSVALIIASAIGIIILVLPAAAKTFALYEDVRNVSKERDELQKKANLLEGLDEETITRELSTLTTAVPLDKSLPTILGTVDGIGTQRGASVDEITLTAPGSLATEAAQIRSVTEKKLGVSTLPVTVTFRGDYDQLKAVIGTISEVRRFLAITDFTLAFPRQATGSSSASLQLTLDAYYAPLIPNEKAAVQSLTPLSDKEEALLAQVGNFPLIAGIAPLSEEGVAAGKSDPFAP